MRDSWDYEARRTGPDDLDYVASAASLIRSIDSCEDIVNELARGYGC